MRPKGQTYGEYTFLAMRQCYVIVGETVRSRCLFRFFLRFLRVSYCLGYVGSLWCARAALIAAGC